MANTHMSRNCCREHHIAANTCKRKSMRFNADFDGGGGGEGGRESDAHVKHCAKHCLLLILVPPQPSPSPRSPRLLCGGEGLAHSSQGVRATLTRAE